MLKDRREIYIELSKEVNGCLCTWCKFSVWEGGCKEAYAICEHPLEVVQDIQEYLDPNSDCWGFRPNSQLPIWLIADIVGVILSEGFDTWFFNIEDGEIKIYGEA